MVKTLDFQLIYLTVVVNMNASAKLRQKYLDRQLILHIEQRHLGSIISRHLATIFAFPAIQIMLKIQCVDLFHVSYVALAGCNGYTIFDQASSLKWGCELNLFGVSKNF